MLPCAGPPTLFYLSVALGLSAFGRSCAWCCRVVCFELLFVLRGIFSLPVHEYVVTGFYWENLRLQTIVTLIGSSLFQPSVPAVLYVWHNTGTSSQPCCSWVYFSLKLKYFKLHLCNEEPTTVFASLAVLWCVVPLATVLACIPIPLQTETVVPGTGGTEGALESLPTTFKHKPNLCPKDKITAMWSMCCVNFILVLFFPSHARLLGSKLFICVFP